MVRMNPELLRQQVAGLDVRNAVLYDVQWQLMRLSLRGTWTNEYAQNIQFLNHYLSEAPDLQELVRRLWRCLNHVASVRSGFKGNAALRDSAAMDALDALYEKLAEWHEKLERVGGRAIYGEWDWQAVEDELYRVPDVAVLEALYEDLGIRNRYAPRRPKVGRPELNFFLSRLRQVILHKGGREVWKL